MKKSVNQTYRQKTLAMVPETLKATSTELIRPMTSKQAKRAHSKRQKASIPSKEDRDAIEREELMRIRKEDEEQRKECERERGRRRAKAAREKTREKQKLELERRRSAGLPLVNVRPSQLTITSFVHMRKSSEGAAEGQERTRQGRESTPVQKRVPLRAVAPTVDAELLEFLEANANEIFPTASQEALELMTDTSETEALPVETLTGGESLSNIEDNASNQESLPSLRDDDNHGNQITTHVKDKDRYLGETQVERATKSEVEQEDRIFQELQFFFPSSDDSWV